MTEGRAGSPLASPPFRRVWLATLGANVGMWMQNVAAAWIMSSLTSSAALVALVQTAISLPFFVIAIPAGALADIVDRRRVVMGAQAWMLACAAALGLLAWRGALEPWSLLALTFALGLGAAVSTPASQALTPELVAREQIPAAMLLSSASFNVARAIGPALGGLAVAAGASLAFFVNAAAFGWMLVAVASIALTRARGDAPDERFGGAMRAGLRYVRHARPLGAVLVRAGAALFGAAAMWALLPVVARDQLGLGSTGYGVMLGCFGAGALAGAPLVQRWRARAGGNAIAGAASVVFAVTMVLAARLDSAPIAGMVFVAGGAAWIGLMSSLNTAAQQTSAGWVRGRALSSYLWVSQGALAIGAAAWGLAASVVGTSAALVAAAAWLAASAALGRVRPIPDGDNAASMEAAAVQAPEVIYAPAPSDGPVLVTVRYRVRAEHIDAFGTAMAEAGVIRRRDGAYAWGLFADLERPGLFVETFLVESWAEHLRQHGRATEADRALESRVRPLLTAPPEVSHLLEAGLPAILRPGG